MSVSYEISISVGNGFAQSRQQANTWMDDDFIYLHIDGLMHERRNSSVLAMELCLSCINPST